LFTIDYFDKRSIIEIGLRIKFRNRCKKNNIKGREGGWEKNKKK
jgi:hypothetical protein